MAEAAPKQEDSDPDQPDDQKKSDDLNKPGGKSLGERMKNDGLSIDKAAAEIRQNREIANAKLKDYVTVKGSRGAILSTKEFTDWQHKLDAAENSQDPARETKKLLEQIEDLPRQKETAAQKEKDDAVELPPGDKKLTDLQEKFDKICEENRHLIGENQVDGFKTWLAEEMRKKPTTGHLEEQIKKLEGKEIEDKNGLAPRRQEYAKLTDLFKTYGLGAPEDNNEWIRREGLSERRDFRKKIETFEDHFAKLKDTGFYSPEMIKKHMGELLKAENPSMLDDKLKEAKDLAREESEGFTHLDEHFQVGDTSMRKLSPESKQKFMEYYKTLDLKERQKLMDESVQKKGLKFFENLANGEASLAKHDPKYPEVYSTNNVQALDQIYKDDPDALKLALQSFEHLDFMQKVEALKKHAVLAKTAQSKEELEKNLTMQAIKAKLVTAKSDKTISEETEQRYIKFFNNPENFKNPDTKKPGDLKEFKKAYEILVNTTPNEQYKNLAAYEERRKKFEKDLKELQKINPAISDEDLKKLQEKYDKEGWTRRERVHNEELKPKIAKENEDRKKRVGLEEKAGMKHGEANTRQSRIEGAPKLAETIKAVTELVSNDQGAEAMKLLLEFNESQPDNPKILFWMQTVANYMKEFGSGKKREKTVEKELEQELDQIVASDKGVQDDLMEQKIKSLNMEGVKQSEQRHDKNISGQARAQKESMGRVQQGSLEAKLTTGAYQQLGKEYMVDKEGKAKKIEKVQFKDNNVNMQEQDRFRMKRETFKEQTKLDKKEGMFTALKNKNNETISHEIAAKLQQAELEKLEKEMAEKAQKKVDGRITSNDSSGAKIFDLNSTIAARRKAKELIDEKRSERIKAA